MKILSHLGIFGGLACIVFACSLWSTALGIFVWGCFAFGLGIIADIVADKQLEKEKREAIFNKAKGDEK